MPFAHRNEYFCFCGRQLYHSIIARVKHFPQNTTHLIVTVAQNCYTLFCRNTQKSLAKPEKPDIIVSYTEKELQNGKDY